MSEQRLEFVYLDLDSIVLHPAISSWRDSYPDGEEDPLVFDIKHHGVLEPVLVRKLDDGKYELIAGNRRYHAAKAADLKTIPCRILDVDDKRALEIALTENLQRKDLNPMELAKAFKSMIDQGYTQKEIAKAFGKSRSWIANHIRLLELPDYVQQGISEGKISPDHGIALLKLKDRPEELKEAYEYACENSVAWTRSHVDWLIAKARDREIRESWGFEPWVLCLDCKTIEMFGMTKQEYEEKGAKCSECGSTNLMIDSWSKITNYKWNVLEKQEDSNDSSQVDEPEPEKELPRTFRSYASITDYLNHILHNGPEISGLRIDWGGLTIYFKEDISQFFPNHIDITAHEYKTGEKTKITIDKWWVSEEKVEKVQKLIEELEASLKQEVTA